MTHRALTAALLWAGFPSAALKQKSGPTSNVGVQHQAHSRDCVADDGFVRNGTMLGESCHTSSAVGSIFVASSRTRLAPVARPVPGKMRPTVTITPQAIPKAFSFGVPIRSRSHGSTPSCVTSPPNCCRSARPRSIRTAWFSSLSLPAVWWAASTDRIEMGWLWSDPAGPSKINSLGPTHENQGWWCPETAGHSPTTPLAPVIEACHRGGPRSRFDHGLLAFLSVPFATSSAVEGIQIGQSAEPDED